MHALAQAWLSLQCKMISGVSHGVVILGSQLAEPLAPTASWPIGSKQHPGLSAAAKIATTNGESISRPYSPDKQSSETNKDIIACPIIIDNKVLGVVAIETLHRNEDGQQALIQMLQWGILWLTFFLEKEKSSQKDRLISLVELIATSHEHDSFHASAMAVANSLASRLVCERVSIGMLRGKSTQVSIISKTAQFDKKSQLIRKIGLMMDETIDQDRLITVPTSDHQPYQITTAHKAFINDYGQKSICTIPLVNNGQITGAICFERSKEIPFTAETIELIEHIAPFIAPVFELKQKNERGLIKRTIDSGKTFTAQFSERKNLRSIALLLVFTIAGIFFSTAATDYRVTANASLAGIQQRAIVAPIEGFIEDAFFSAGDVVRKNDLLVKLSDKDLKLERVKWLNQRQQFQKEYRTELANHDRANIGILNAKIKQAEARIALLNGELSHTEIRSPFDGIIVNGDLSNNLGSPVEKGNVLFEITPQNHYRIILEVDEAEITSVQKGQQGELLLTALPDKQFSFTVDKVTPVASAEEGKNYFRVEALLQDNAPKHARPGMQGIGKIAIEERKLIWVLTHKLTDWFRLWSWSWRS